MHEYGVRTFGGHITASVSRHLAVREVERRREAGERNVWLVTREVSEWTCIHQWSFIDDGRLQCDVCRAKRYPQGQ